MKINRLVRTPKDLGAFRVKLLTLCFFFAFGAVLGCVAHGLVTQEDDLLLRQYMVEYARLAAVQEDQAASVFDVVGVYFRYPVAAFIFGFTAVGLFFIPLSLVLQGFTLAFSVASFASALGRGGLTLALAAFGLRCLIVLPITLLLSIFSLDGALCLWHERHSGHGKRKARYGAEHYFRFAVCVIILLTGVVAELVLVPKLFGLALAGIL